MKYGVTQNLTADLTYRTDFAQVEVDEQQVNLTRFSLLFPEKRTFFLEGQGIFDFGIGAGPNVGGADVPTLFFSRQIGLSRNQPVPIIAGGRVTGKVGAYRSGALSIQTDDEAELGAVSTNFRRCACGATSCAAAPSACCSPIARGPLVGQRARQHLRR